jgi:hypothetical protein
VKEEEEIYMCVHFGRRDWKNRLLCEVKATNTCRVEEFYLLEYNAM